MARFSVPSFHVAITCDSCGGNCTGEVLKVQDKHFHIKCFTCKGKPVLFSPLSFPSTFPVPLSPCLWLPLSPSLLPSNLPCLPSLFPSSLPSLPSLLTSLFPSSLPCLPLSFPPASPFSPLSLPLSLSLWPPAFLSSWVFLPS